MKQRFSSLDIKVIAHELSTTLTSLRVSNIYDLSSRIFLIKFHKPGQREQVLIETGFRCHLTSFTRTTATTPSPFVTRLRKYLKSRRVSAVRQLGTDRIIEITFGDGHYRLFLEFYAAGNLVLTDGELNILALFRNVSDEHDGEGAKLGVKYVVEGRQNLDGAPPVDKADLEKCLKDGKQWDEQNTTEIDKSGKKRKNKNARPLRRTITTGFPQFPPPLVDHVLDMKEIDLKSTAAIVLETNGTIALLHEALQEAERIIESLAGENICTGSILAKRRKVGPQLTEPVPEGGTTLTYEDFQPFLPQRFQNDKDYEVLQISGYNATVDKFFSSVETQKVANKLVEWEERAQQKLASGRKDQERRVDTLKKDQEINMRKAQAIQANVEWVDEVIAAVNGLMEQGKDWMDIAALIEIEQQRDNPVALMISLPLKLYESKISILLTEGQAEGEDDYESDRTEDSVPSSEDEAVGLRSAMKKDSTKKDDKRLLIDIDLTISSWANAKRYHDHRRFAVEKERKTVISTESALKSHEKKVMSELKRGLQAEKDVLRPVRQQFWFEKFWFFLSSEGYLVLGGKDPQQEELLYRKHFKRGDVHVHCDVDGATPLFIKNHKSTPSAPISPSTLRQAGIYAVATSSAWNAKAVMPAWWAPFEQVSKIAPSGDVLPPGRFYVKGEKNFLPPTPPALGLSVLFLVDERSKKSHLKHRVSFTKAENPSETPLRGGSETENNGQDEAKSGGSDDSSDAEDFPDVEFNSDGDYDNHNDSKKDKNPALNALLSSTRSQPQKIPSRTKFHEERPQTSISHVEENNKIHILSDATPNSSPSSSKAPSISSTPNPSGPQPLPRGARSKAKRAALKYKDQDPEDKAMALHLLGSGAGDERRRAEEIAKALRDKELEDQQRRKAEKKARAADLAREVEVKRVREMEAERDADVGGEDGKNKDEDALAIDLESLVSNPLPGDNILAVFPTCAPWPALANAKYRAKLQPGSVKKSKALKEILYAWGAGAVGTEEEKTKAWAKNVDSSSTDREKAWSAEIEGVRGWRDVEVIGIIPVSLVRVGVSGVVVRGGKGGDKGKGSTKGGKGGGKGKGGGGGKKKK
ncbi:MAG: hypothetical protein M1814_000853 [Vezdaea aestivalis]|nr:MAG: hypothetical protein M1814_000853 [Vezdaea aestivalis]